MLICGLNAARALHAVLIDGGDYILAGFDRLRVHWVVSGSVSSAQRGLGFAFRCLLLRAMLICGFNAARALHAVLIDGGDHILAGFDRLRVHWVVSSVSSAQRGLGFAFRCLLLNAKPKPR